MRSLLDVHCWSYNPRNIPKCSTFWFLACTRVHKIDPDSWLSPHIHSLNPHINHVFIQPSLTSKPLSNDSMAFCSVHGEIPIFLLLRAHHAGEAPGEVRGPGSTAAGWLPFGGIASAGERFSLSWICVDISSPQKTWFWLVVWLPSILFSHILGCCHHPNWRSHIFQRGGPTTKKQGWSMYNRCVWIMVDDSADSRYFPIFLQHLGHWWYNKKSWVSINGWLQPEGSWMGWDWCTKIGSLNLPKAVTNKWMDSMNHVGFKVFWYFSWKEW